MHKFLVLSALIATAAVAVAAPAPSLLNGHAIARYAAHKVLPFLVPAPEESLSEVPRHVMDAADDCATQLASQAQSTFSGTECEAIMSENSAFGDNTTPAQLTQQLTILCSSSCYGPLIDFMTSLQQCLASSAGAFPGGNGGNSGGSATGGSTNSGGSASASASVSDILSPRLIQFMCTKNEVGDFCLASFANPAITNHAVTNTSACDVYTNFGCCATSVMNVLSDQPVSAWNSVLNYCGLADAPACPIPNVEYQVIVVKVRIQNVLFSWVTQTDANRAVAVVALKRDLARLWNVPVGYIQIVSLAEGSLIANLQVRGANDTATAAVQSAVSAGVANSQATFTSLESALPSSAKENPSAGFSLDVSSSSATTETQITEAGAAPVRAVVWSFGAIIATAVVTLALNF